MNVKKVKQSLFDLYSADLVEFFPDYPNRFLCPICRLLFTRKSLTDENGLTLEHCIPEALGGQVYTLTCKSCNNGSGSKLDVHLINKLLADDFFDEMSSGPVDGTLTIEGNR